NAVTDYLAGQPAYRKASAKQLFEEARRLVTWHYQWIILHEYLPLTIGQERVSRILSQGLKSFRIDHPSNSCHTPDGRKMPRLPIEFSVAAFRFGHSQVRPSYRANFGAPGGEPFFAFI